jgi:hypothetical protein
MKQQVNIPSSLDEITVDQYQKFVKLITDNPDSTFTRQKTVAILCRLDMEFVRTIKMHSIDDIYTDLLKMFDSKPPLIDRFKINGKEFGFIPNLDDMTAGEFADLDDYFQNAETWHKMLAVLYRPVTKKLANAYDIEAYKGTEQYAEVMKDTPVSIAIGAQVFFYNLGRELLSVTMDSLQQLPQQQKEIIAEKLNLVRNGDGITAFTQLQGATLLRLTEQQN